jgi:hypothetical protein
MFEKNGSKEQKLTDKKRSEKSLSDVLSEPWVAREKWSYEKLVLPYSGKDFRWTKVF